MILIHQRFNLAFLVLFCASNLPKRMALTTNYFWNITNLIHCNDNMPKYVHMALYVIKP
ncbi:uncharacterized protein DS421_19g639680 [Arachis hypogaea]|uniref:Uncharacterized protein n=1 Tax=Arachis hypogaea TaxID=3818 RepID=A0A6B9V642_ARAHY|nr:uncharacterized protein DS421_19g639680 [Arachis hypogaea]